MKALVFGKTGQVARALARILPDAEFRDRSAVDLTDPQACGQAVAETDADVVSNAAAYTAVDKAEDDTETAFQVNADAPIAMASAAKARGLPFVHISTDYVFDGSGEAPWTVDAPTAPLGAYGGSKLAGEDGIRAIGGTHAILRTSWVFSADGANFVKTMLRVSEARDALSVVNDQIGGPTSAAAIARACVTIAQRLSTDPSQTGTYHFSGAPDVSWAEFARTIFQLSGRSVTVTDIPSEDYPTPAPRPKNSRLDCTTLEQTFGVARADWRADLRAVLKTLDEVA